VSDRELTLTKIINAPRHNVWRCWTEAALLQQWFAPRPWTTPRAELDLRPGGATLVVMRGPNGEQFPNHGVYLEIVPEQKLVFTDAYVRAWEPAEKPFFTAVLTFEALDGGITKYVARALHWTVEDRERHEKMGFHQGWAQCADQLQEVARQLA
jgi:uncharacterized protein YndB with AHSA1/START domain